MTVGTTELRGDFPGGPVGTTWSLRARVRGAADPNRASGLSPEATITVG